MLSRRCVSANQGPGDREAGSGGRPVIRSPYSPPPRPCDARSERWCRPSARRGGGAVLPLAVAVSRGLRERGSKGTGVSPYRATAEPVPGGAAGEGRPGNRRAVARGCRPGPAGPVPGAGCRVPGAGCRVPGAGCWVPGADAACRVLRAGPAGRDPEEGASRHDGRTSRAGEVGGFAGGGGMMAATTTRPHRSRPRYSHPVSFEGPSASWPTRPEAARAVLRQRPRLCPHPLPPVSQGEVQASCHGSIDLSRDFLFGRDFLYLQDQLVQPLHRGSARARGVPRCAL